MPNTPPGLAGLTAAITFSENVVNSAPQLLDADVTLTDAEGNFSGGTVTVSGLLAEDRVGIRHQGTGPDQIGVSGSAISYEGILIGAVAGGVGGTLSVTLNAAATVEAVDALIQNLTYANVSDRPTASRELAVDVIDGDGASLFRPARFTQLTGAANPFTSTGDASSPSPSFVDFDRDGDMDAVIGNILGTLRTFRNDGGAFTELTGTANVFNGVDVGDFSAPSFTDLDGDGDMDAVIGSHSGSLRSFRNDGGAYTELTGAANPFNGVDVGTFSAPGFGDVDGDGDIDAVVGDLAGLLHMFRNAGGAFTELIGAANPLGGATINALATPAFVDLDGDRDVDLIVGTPSGALRALRNDGGTFTELTGAANPFDGVDAGYSVIPSFADVDSDGDLDAVVGDYHGSLLTFDNVTPRGRPIVVNVTAVNDAPTLAGLAGGVVFHENDVNAAPQRLDADIVFTDDDSFDGGFLVVTGLLEEDRLTIRNEGNAAGHIGLAGNSVTYGGIVIGSVFGGLGDTLAVFFNAAASSEAIDALIQNLTYANVSDTPVPSRNLVLGVTTGDGSHVEQSINVHVAPGNEVPVLADLAPSVTFQEGAAPVLLDANVTFTDAEGNIAGGTLTVSSLLAEDRVGIRSQGTGADQIHVAGTAISYEGILIGTAVGGVGGTLTVTFNAAASVEAVDALIQNLTYFNASYAPTASHELVLNVRDGDGAWLGGQARFAQLTGAANPFDGAGGFYAPSPSFVDLDRDGDLDAVIGINAGTLRTFRNDGGSFTGLAGPANPFNGIAVGGSAAPSFTDLDGDGDMDAVVGAGAGDLRSFRNDGGAFTELTGAANPFNGVDVGVFSAPAFADLDGDGDMDAVVGNGVGVLTAFRNNGGAFTEQIGAANPFNGVYFDYYATPAFVDLDGDRDMDLILGTPIGVLIALRNDGGTFTQLTGAANPFDGVDAGRYVIPSFADIDSDGDVDAAIGDYTGSLLTFDNITGQSITVNATPIIETVHSAVSWTLAANVENLILTGTASINGTGNALANILTGNSGNNMLDGAAGADMMRGGAGDDTYLVDNILDQVFEVSPANGFDTVRSSVTFGLGSYQERLVLTGAAAIDANGNSLDNVLLGNSGANILNGGQGADQMRGFGGNDTYIVDNAGDTVTEISPADGIDLVRSSVSFSLGSYVENLVLTGTAAIDGNGNALVNSLTGNGANNQLNGGAGADTMTGGAGDDSYTVDHVGDMVVETGGNGTDTVRSGVDYVLSAAIENLILTGSAVSGTGNGAANTINGNNAANSLAGGGNADTLTGNFGTDTLDGGIGNDRLYGGASSDDLIGGAGLDSFYFDAPLNAAVNVDHILDFRAADDTIFLDRDIFTGIGADGAIGAAAFRLGTSALDADDRILYNSATGQISYDADGLGGTAAILFATVNSGTVLTSADFIGF